MAIKSLVARGWQGVAKYLQALVPTLVTLTGSETLTNKTLTAPAITSPNLTFGVATHDYAGAAVDWTLSAAELKANYIVVTNANGACAALATVVAGKPYWILNTSGQAFTFKKSGGTGVVVASTKAAVVIGNAAGTDYIRMTGDA